MESMWSQCGVKLDEMGRRGGEKVEKWEGGVNVESMWGEIG